MSIDMFVAAAQSQASSVTAKCQADQEAYEKMNLLNAQLMLQLW